METIIDKWIKKETIEYLVIWSNENQWIPYESGEKYPDEWIREEKIDSTEIIQEFHDRQAGKKQKLQQSVQVRRSTRSSTIRSINLAFTILQMLIGCYGKQVNIKEEFLLYDRSRTQYIDIETMCDINTKLPEKLAQRISTGFSTEPQQCTTNTDMDGHSVTDQLQDPSRSTITTQRCDMERRPNEEQKPVVWTAADYRR